MRILHVIASADPAGGGPIEGIKQLAAVISGWQHTVEVASLDSPDAEWIKAFPLPLYALGPGSLRYQYCRQWLPWLRDNVRRYDVVIINGLWQYHSFGAWRALRHCSLPYVLFTHGMLDPWFKRQYPLKHLKKCLYWPWGDYRVLREAAAVLFTSEEERVLAAQSFWPYRCNGVLLGYGTAAPPGDPPAQRAGFLARYPQLQGKRLLLFMGRIHPIKGCDLAIRAFAQMLRAKPDFHLVIAGPDQLGWRRDLQEMAGRLGIAGRITWTGMLAEDLKWGAFRAAEAFLLPSHHENFGLVIAEALACGLPVLITTGVNIWREVVADGAGLAAPDTLAGTAGLLRSWSGLLRQEREQYRTRAQACFLRRFEIHKTAENLVSVLRGTLPQSQLKCA